MELCLKCPSFPNESSPKKYCRENNILWSLLKGGKTDLILLGGRKGIQFWTTSYKTHTHTHKNKIFFSSRKRREHIQESSPTSQTFSAKWRWRERKEVIAQGSNTSRITCCWKIIGFKGKFEHLYKQTGTLQTVIRVLIKYCGIAKEAIVRKEQPPKEKKIDRT